MPAVVGAVAFQLLIGRTSHGLLILSSKQLLREFGLHRPLRLRAVGSLDRGRITSLTLAPLLSLVRARYACHASRLNDWRRICEEHRGIAPHTDLVLVLLESEGHLALW